VFIVNALPNHELAIIEDSKLIDYALSSGTERGQHKAHVFVDALGFDVSNWPELKEAIMDALPNHEAQFSSETAFGRKFVVVLPITGPNG